MNTIFVANTKSLFFWKETSYGTVQNPPHGRVLRVATGLEDHVRRTFAAPCLPAGGSQPDQLGRLPRAPPGEGPQGSDRTRLAQSPGPGDGRPRRGRQSEGLRPDRARHAGAAIRLARCARTAGPS